MKTKFFYVICALFIAMMCSCSGGDYKNAIPADSDVVVMVNLKNLAEKADLAHSKAMELAKENMGIVVNSKDREKAQALMDDPASMGIDFREPACLFHRADGSYGLVMKVLDGDDLEDFLQVLRGNNVVSKAVERDGVKCCKLFDEIAMVYDKHALMLYANSMMKASEREMKEAVALMKQDEDMSYKSTYTFETDVDNKDIVAMSNNLRRGIQEIMPKGSPMPWMSGMNDVATLLSVNFQDGKVAMQMELLPLTDKDKESMKEMESHLRKIKGTYHAYDTSYVPVWAYMGVEGKWLLKELKRNNTIKEYLFMLERCIDIEQMIAAVDGDFVFSFDPERESAITAVGAVKNSDFLKDVDYWTESMKEYGATMSRMSPTDYCLRVDGNKLFWGMLHDNLYVSTIGRPEHDSGKMLDQLIGDDQLDDYWLYARIDCRAMQLAKYADSFEARQVADKLQSIVIKSEELGRIAIDVNMIDKSRNILKAWME